MIQAGRLRHRVAIEKREELRVGGDLLRVEWTPFTADAANVPAEIVPMSARDFIAAQATQSEVSVRITIRYMPGIDASMRVRRLDDGRVYNIAGVLEDNRSGREWITLSVTQGVNEG